MLPRALAALLCLVAILSLSGGRPAVAEPPQKPFSVVVAEWNATLEQMAKDLAAPVLSASHAERLKANLAGILASTRQAKDEATAQIKPLRAELDALGPPPAAPQTVKTAVPEFIANLALLARSPLDWWRGLSADERESTVLYRFAIVVLLAIGIGWAIRRALIHWFGRDATIEQPTYARRLTGAIAAALAYGIVPSLILAAFLYRALDDASVISGLFSEAFVAFCIVMIMFTLAWALPRAVLAPDLPAWRLLPVSPDHARAISRRITFLAAVFAVDLFFGLASRSLVIPDELISLYTLIVNTLEAIGILALVQGRVWVTEETAEPEDEDNPLASERATRFWITLRRLVGLIALAVIVTALIGYANLSRYLSQNLVLSGMIVGGLVLVRGLCRELVGMALRSRLLRVELDIPHRTRNRTKFWLRAILDLIIYIWGLLLILVVWGVPLSEVWGAASKALLGFTIGNVTISIADIAVALLIFLAVTMLTRAVQRVLTERVFPQTGLDAGVRNSLSAGLGYVGLAIAAMLAVSALGLDLANIALIAGALSVGIGFGLQNIVNNFVSGLILLIERPIKVGDWINVGGHEGHVKQINVRATEIETFQRASVIVPNSELLSSAVINWTHKDRYGRAEVSVGVAYGSDVEQVMKILRACLDANKDILAWPEPTVVLQNFGDSALEFDARGYIDDVERRIFVQSDLRLAINRAFVEAGIVIPFPHRDIHIRNFDQIKDALRGAGPAAKG